MTKTLMILALIIGTQSAQAAVKGANESQANAFVEMSCGLSGTGSVFYSLELVYAANGIKFLKGSAVFLQKDYAGKIEAPVTYPVIATITRGQLELSSPQHPSKITVKIVGEEASGNFESVIQNIKSSEVSRMGYGGPAACIATSDVY
jgi:hypothetical protein